MTMKGCKMFFQPLLLLMVLQEVHLYYLYNPYSHKIITLSSLSNVPDGYKLIPPPYERRFRRRDENHIGECSDPGFICNKPYDSLATYQFHCSKDSQCPKSFKCCRHRCFSHRICVKAIIHSTDIGKKQHNSNRERQGTCEKWPYNCQIPYHHSLTSTFKCDNDRQCPKAYKCCQQSCFEHKICSKAIVHSDGYVEELRRKEKKNTDTTVNSEIEKGISVFVDVRSATLTSTTTEDSLIEGNDEETSDMVETTENLTVSDSEETSEIPTSESIYTFESSESITENAPITTNEDSVTESETASETIESVVESETASETIASESSSSTNDSENLTEVTTETEYTNSDDATEREESSTTENSTPDPNAIFPEYSDFYDNQNDTEYDTYS